MTDVRMLGDRYEIAAPLGRGGMATVYRGRDRVLGRAVAVKVLAERYAGDEKFVTRFRREARAAAGLNHTNIVSVFDTGDSDGQHYIVMEMVNGETLSDLLKREGPLSPDRAAWIAGSIARALHAAHGRDLIHRDVKPGNVMLTRDGDVKVMDFGIARAATDDTLTQTGMVLGTASYLSPEQSRGEPVDHRSDIYSLGCVLYEMLGGRPPFAGETPVGVAYKHVHERPEPLARTNSAVPAEVEAVVMRALEKDPADRHQSAEEFREALTSAVTDASTEPLVEATAVLPATDTTQPLSHRPRPRRWWPAAVVGVVVLVIGGILAVALTGDDSRERRRQNRRGGVEPTSSPSLTEVDAALLALVDLVDESSGLLPPDAAQGIVDEAGLAVEAYDAGDLDEAAGHLDFADAGIDAALAEGSTTEGTALLLHQGVAQLRTAMGLIAVPTDTPSPFDEGDEGEGDGDGDSGPGNSENAPGHKKGKEEDD
jgi:serine/threonine-protein kinase